MLSQSVLHVQEGTSSEGNSVSEVIKQTASEGFQKTSNLNKVSFSQQSSNMHSGIQSYKVEKGSKMNYIIYLATTGIRRSAKLA